MLWTLFLIALAMVYFLVLVLPLLSLVSSLSASQGIKVPFQHRAPNGPVSLDVSSLCDWSADPFGFTNVEGLAYTGTIYVDGDPFQVCRFVAAVALHIKRRLAGAA